MHNTNLLLAYILHIVLYKTLHARRITDTVICEQPTEACLL